MGYPQPVVTFPDTGARAAHVQLDVTLEAFLADLVEEARPRDVRVVLLLGLGLLGVEHGDVGLSLCLRTGDGGPAGG